MTSLIKVTLYLQRLYRQLLAIIKLTTDEDTSCNSHANIAPLNGAVISYKTDSTLSLRIQNLWGVPWYISTCSELLAIKLIKLSIDKICRP